MLSRCQLFLKHLRQQIKEEENMGKVQMCSWKIEEACSNKAPCQRRAREEYCFSCLFTAFQGKLNFSRSLNFRKKGLFSPFFQLRSVQKLVSKSIWIFKQVLNFVFIKEGVSCICLCGFCLRILSDIHCFSFQKLSSVLLYFLLCWISAFVF